MHVLIEKKYWTKPDLKVWSSSDCPAFTSQHWYVRRVVYVAETENRSFAQVQDDPFRWKTRDSISIPQSQMELNGLLQELECVHSEEMIHV